MTKTTTSISISKELLEKIDVKRGLAPRSAFIEFLLNKSLEGQDGTAN